jgi:hypothetical protein
MKIKISDNPRIVTIPDPKNRVSIDDPTKKTVAVKFTGVPMDALVIWSGAEYDAAGAWTDAQLDTAIAAKLAALA